MWCLYIKLLLLIAAVVSVHKTAAVVSLHGTVSVVSVHKTAAASASKQLTPWLTANHLAINYNINLNIISITVGN